MLRAMRLTYLSCALAVIAASGFAAAPALAADRGALVRAENDTLVYPPEFFVDFNPQTALDMVSRVPGFSIQGGGGSRGLSGSLGNVLINGRRPSSKNGVATLLSRLPAASVERIELIRSPLPGIDMAGQDQVVNVIVSGDGSWNGTWTGRIRAFENERLVPEGNVSATRTQGLSSLTLAVSLDGHADGRDAERRFFLADETFLGNEIERNQQSFFDVTPSLAWTREFEAGHALRVDARVWTWGFGNNRNGTSFDANGTPTGFEAALSDTSAWGGEGTVDYDHVFNETWSAKLTGLQRYTDQDEDDFFDFFGADGGFRERIRIVEAETEGESVLRSELRRAQSDDRSWTFAIEGAFNFLDGDLAITSDTGAGPVAVPLPVSDVRVEERRVDASLQHIWRVSDALTLDITGAVERSEISQTGDAEQTRELTYIKPEFLAIWTPNETDQFRLSLVRQVDQLSFGEFVSSVNVNDNVTNVGNPNLEPERRWRLQADWERRFWEEGTLTLLVRHEWVEGVSDIVPFGTTGGEGPGNLGDGRRLRFQANLDLPTDRLGIPGGLLSMSGMTRETLVDDPITGEERRFRNDEDWRFNIDFRQDLPERGLAWGMDYRVQGKEDFYRRARFERTTPSRGNIDFFVEARLPRGLTARVGGDLNLGDSERERFDWPVSRADGFPTEIERRATNEDGVVYFELTGTF